jgi:hypothetical protein
MARRKTLSMKTTILFFGTRSLGIRCASAITGLLDELEESNDVFFSPVSCTERRISIDKTDVTTALGELRDQVR